MNGDDRWPDVLSRRLHAIHGNRVAVVNAGIGGNQVAGPAEYARRSLSPAARAPGAAGARRAEPVRRHQLDLAGRHQRLQPERQCQRSRRCRRRCGTRSAASAREVPAGAPDRRDRDLGAGQHQRGARLRRAGREAEGAERLHPHVRHRSTASIDFDAATLDPATGGLRPEMVPDSTTGGAGDKLHPNRAGYLAMGMASTSICSSRCAPAGVPSQSNDR